MPLYDVFEELIDYTGFSSAHAERLTEMAPLVRDSLPDLVERFYAAIERSPGASSVFEDQGQIERLKASLLEWIERFFSGVYDSSYVAARAQIGMVHVAIGLEQRYMFGAMNVIREGIQEAFLGAANAHGWTSERVFEGVTAIHKLCDLELAIMLETYALATNERLRAHERLAAIGQLSASVAHELRNPLAAVDMSCVLIGRRTAEEHSRKHAERIGAQVRFAIGVIDGLLALSRDEPPKRRPTHVAEVVRDALESSRPRADVELRAEIEPDLPRVSVDPVQLRQVISNLVTNAAQAIAGENRPGTVCVRAAVDGEDLVVTVEDDGPGLNPAVRAHLFEPLFTTRLKGVGLGLALCRRIVERHGGSLEASNREPQGAAFVVRLPGAGSG